MKKRKIIFVGILIFFSIALIYFIDRFSYSKELPLYPINEKNDTTLTIAIIGDSWVAGEKLDTILQNILKKDSLYARVISSGHSGAKSKLIYQDLFEEKDKEHSSKFIIESCPDFCVVIAGVNDAASQIGSHYYSYHIRQIIKTLLHYKIKPIIISLPEFGIEETISNMNVLSKTRNLVSAYFNNSGEIDNIKTYRMVLAEDLQKDRLNDSILLIDFDEICPAYNKYPEYYSNPSHLSLEGNKNLCRKIALLVEHEIKKR